MHAHHGDDGRAAAHTQGNDVLEHRIVCWGCAVVGDVHRVGDDFVGGQYRISAGGHGRFGYRKTGLQHVDGLIVGDVGGRTGGCVVAHGDCVGKANVVDLRMDEVEHSGAVNDDKRIIGGVAIGWIDKGADGEGHCGGSGGWISRYHDVGGRDVPMNKRRHSAVWRRGVAVDIGDAFEDQPLGQGVDYKHIVEGAFLQAQAQFVLHNIADADHIIAGTIGVQQTGLGGGGGVPQHHRGCDRADEVIVVCRGSGAVTLIAAGAVDAGPPACGTVAQALVEKHSDIHLHIIGDVDRRAFRDVDITVAILQ